MIKKSLIIAIMFFLICAGMKMTAVKAESIADNSRRSYEGSAYVVLTSDKELIFFRSENEYDDHYREISAEDILGNTYRGKVYRIDETGDIISGSPWYFEQDNFTAVRVADGQAVRPASLRGMFMASSNLVSADLEGIDSSAVTDMALLFASCPSLKSVNMTGMDTSGVTDMSGMFSGCESLEALDLRGLDTSSVTDFSSMFADCEALSSLDISSFDTANVTDFNHMFGYCRNLKEIDVSRFDTSSACDMGNMFFECNSLENVDVSGFDTSSVTDMSDMFYECNSLESVDVSHFDTGNVTDFRWMFAYCNSLESLDVSGFNTQSAQNMGLMFAGCSGLESIDVSGFETDSVTDFSWMFSKCASLESLDVSRFNTQSAQDMEMMFEGCSSLKSIDVSNFITSGVTVMDYMFCGCTSLLELDVSSFDTAAVTDMHRMFAGCSGLKALNVSGLNTSNVENMSEMFYCCSSLTSLDLSSFNTGKVRELQKMFYGCTSLGELDISGFNTASAGKMTDMFKSADELCSVTLGPGFTYWTDQSYLPEGIWANKEKNISMNARALYSQYPSHAAEYAGRWERIGYAYAVLCGDELIFFRSNYDYSSAYSGRLMSVEDIEGNQYYGNLYQDIESPEFSDYNMPWNSYREKITKVTTIPTQMIRPAKLTDWFKITTNLVSADLRGFDTSDVEDMSGLFELCMKLESVNMAGLDTSSVTNMARMFHYDMELKDLDITGFNTENVTDFSEMFSVCMKLQSLDVSSFKTGSAVNMKEMFYACTQIPELDLSGFDTSGVTDMTNMFDSCNNLEKVTLGKDFTGWINDARLPDGTWKNESLGLSKSASELYEQYPAHASEWAGVWTRDTGRIKVTGIRMSPQSTVKYGSTASLDAHVLPENAYNQSIRYSSDDESIVTVDVNGRITGKKIGTANITATTAQGSYSAVCQVRVLFTDVSRPDQYFYEPVYWAVDNGITVGAGGAGKFSPNNPCTREQIVTFLWRLMDEPEPETQSSFTDVEKNAWYYKPITWAYENHITTGLNDGTGRFGVGQPCTREQCVTFLYRAAEEPPVTSHESFTDVAEGRYYYDAISWAASKKITVGLNDGTGRFGVGQKCTRAMIVTFLSRYAHTV